MPTRSPSAASGAGRRNRPCRPRAFAQMSSRTRLGSGRRSISARGGRPRTTSVRVVPRTSRSASPSAKAHASVSCTGTTATDRGPAAAPSPKACRIGSMRRRMASPAGLCRRCAGTEGRCRRAPSAAQLRRPRAIARAAAAGRRASGSRPGWPPRRGSSRAGGEAEARGSARRSAPHSRRPERDISRGQLGRFRHIEETLDLRLRGLTSRIERAHVTDLVRSHARGEARSRRARLDDLDDIGDDQMVPHRGRRHGRVGVDDDLMKCSVRLIAVCHRRGATVAQIGHQRTEPPLAHTVLRLLEQQRPVVSRVVEQGEQGQHPQRCRRRRRAS